MDTHSSGSYVLRQGRSVQADEVYFAWTSGDLNKMVAALSVPTNPIDRHFLLQTIVKLTYGRRSNPGMRKRCKEVAELHISEFPRIIPALKRDLGTLPRVTTFQFYATILQEDGAFDRAIEICTTAIRYGLEDGTKAGFEGRIARVEKKRTSLETRGTGG